MRAMGGGVEALQVRALDDVLVEELVDFVGRTGPNRAPVGSAVRRPFRPPRCPPRPMKLLAIVIEKLCFYAWAL